METPATEPFVMTTRGPDQKGLVARAAMTAVIAGYGANISNLQAVFKGGINPKDNIMIYELDLPTAIGVINKKTTAARLIPVPGKKAGGHAFFGGLLGEATIIPVSNSTGSNDFIRLGGLISAPIQSLTN